MSSDDDKEDFVRLSLTDSTYARVIFHDVKDWYMSCQDLKCVCTVMSPNGPQTGDQIGLYRVGWSSVEDYVAAVPCDISNSESIQSSSEVTFNFCATSLPKDDGNYYQFCYTSIDGEIRGGSVPFTFKSSPVDDLCSVEDFENDLLLIQTRTSVLEESLQKAIKEKTNIQIERQLLQKALDAQKTNVAALETSLKDKELTIIELGSKIAEIDQVNCKKETALKEEISQHEHFISGLKIAVTTLQKEKEDLNNQFQHCVSKNKLLKDANSEFQSQLAALKCKVTSQCTEIQSHLDVIRNLRDNSSSLERQTNEKAKQLRRLEEELKEQHALNENVTSRLVDTEHMLTAMATSKSLAAEELQKHLEQEAELEKAKRNLEENSKLLQSEVEQLKLDKSKLQKNLDDSLLEISGLKEENYLLLKKLDKGSTLESEIRDLHRRLALGAEEYKRKYLECHKLQKKVEKLQHKLLQVGSSMVTNTHGVQNDSSRKASSELQTAALDESTRLTVAVADTGDLNSVSLMPIQDGAARSTKTVVQNAKLFAEMENQLQQFSEEKTTCSSLEMASSTLSSASDTSNSSVCYPYPQFYPYPYPNPATQPGHHQYQMCAVPQYESHESASQGYYNYMTPAFQNQPQQAIPNVPPSFDSHTSSYNNFHCTNVYQPTHHYQNPELPVGSETIAENQDFFMPCPICNEAIPETNDINDHIDTHLYYSCPICPVQYLKEDYSYEDFNRHVSDHID